MKVLYVIDSLAPGGAETSLVAMTGGLVRAGVELHVLPLGARMDLESDLVRAGAVVHNEHPRAGRVQNVRSVMKTAREITPQLIHTTLFESNVAGRTAARLLHLPASTSIVSDTYGPSHYAEANAVKLHAARTLDVATASFASRFHAVSRAVAESVGPRLHIAPQIIDVIPRGRSPESFPFQQPGLRERTRISLRVGNSTTLILAVGRLEPAKGLVHLLNALPLFALQHPHAVVLVAGKDGRSGEGLRTLAHSTPLDVRFLGHRADVASLLAAADVLCFPSEREGSPGTLIEAMAVGCPVVASSIPSAIEILGTGPDAGGLVCPVGDPTRLANALNNTLTDATTTTHRTREGRSRFERLFTTDAVVEQMEDFFHQSTAHAPSC